MAAPERRVSQDLIHIEVLIASVSRETRLLCGLNTADDNNRNPQPIPIPYTLPDGRERYFRAFLPLIPNTEDVHLALVFDQQERLWHIAKVQSKPFQAMTQREYSDLYKVLREVRDNDATASPEELDRVIRGAVLIAQRP